MRRLDVIESLVVRAVRKRFRARLRRMMRAYSHLNTTKQLGRFRRVRADLVNIPLDRTKLGVSRFFFGAATAHAELAIRQYLLAHLAGARLHRALLISLGFGSSPVVYPLPNSWQEILIAHGFAVARTRCTVAWMVLMVIYWGHGVLSVVRHTAEGVGRIVKTRQKPLRPYAYFSGLTARNLPRPGEDGRSHDVMTWYARWSGRPKGIAALYHSARETKPTVVDGLHVDFLSHPVAPIGNPASLLRFLVWGIRAGFRAALDGLRGRWWHALMLAECTSAARMRYAGPDAVAVDYLFHNSSHIERPLWTYEAEEKGARILFYFYSISEQFKVPAGYEPDRDEWGAMSWPAYLVWDTYQADLIQRAVGRSPHVDVVGPIWFESSPLGLPPVPPGSIAVFDIEPHRHSAHFGISTRCHLYPDFPEVARRFLLDIKAALDEYGGVMLHKRKRQLKRSVVHGGYSAALRTLSSSDRVIPVHPDTAAIRVIEKCEAVISAPFTSTAILGREQGKPSVYYDPMGVIQKDDRGAHGIPVLHGQKELRLWLMEVFNAPAHPQAVQ